MNSPIQENELNAIYDDYEQNDLEYSLYMNRGSRRNMLDRVSLSKFNLIFE
jgi:hypothetical protein